MGGADFDKTMTDAWLSRCPVAHADAVRFASGVHEGFCRPGAIHRAPPQGAAGSSVFGFRCARLVRRQFRGDPALLPAGGTRASTPLSSAMVCASNIRVGRFLAHPHDALRFLFGHCAEGARRFPCHDLRIGGSARLDLVPISRRRWWALHASQRFRLGHLCLPQACLGLSSEQDRAPC
jgi:hypothetical protein